MAVGPAPSQTPAPSARPRNIRAAPLTRKIVLDLSGKNRADSVKLVRQHKGKLAAIVWNAIGGIDDRVTAALSALGSTAVTVRIGYYGSVRGLLKLKAHRKVISALDIYFESWPLASQKKKQRIKAERTRDIKLLAALRGIPSLSLTLSLVDKKRLFESLARIPMLASLSLVGITSTNSDIRNLPHLAKLTRLGLALSKMDTHVVRSIARLKALVALAVVNPKGKLSVRSLRHLKRLRKLTLTGAHLNGTLSNELCSLSGLVELRLDDTQAPKMDDLRCLKRLVMFSASSTKLDDNLLLTLGSATNLRHLRIPYTQVTDKGLVALRSLAGLRTLDVSYTRISHLGLRHLNPNAPLAAMNISNTSCGDDCLKTISKYRTLRRLYASDTGISDAGLPNLYGMKQLRTVSLIGTKVTVHGVAKARQMMPACTVAK